MYDSYGRRVFLNLSYQFWCNTTATMPA
jgi:hypothetical protein